MASEAVTRAAATLSAIGGVVAFDNYIVARGSSLEEVQLAFGADLTRPLDFQGAEDEHLEGSSSVVGTFAALGPDLVVALMMDSGLVELSELLAQAVPKGRGAKVTAYPGAGVVYLSLVDQGAAIAHLEMDRLYEVPSSVEDELTNLLAIAVAEEEPLHAVAVAIAEAWVGGLIPPETASALGPWYGLAHLSS
jgi:hypothetical protein